MSSKENDDDHMIMIPAGQRGRLLILNVAFQIARWLHLIFKNITMDKDDGKKPRRDNNKYVIKSREKKKLDQKKQEEGLDDAKRKLKLLKQMDDKLDIDIKTVRRVKEEKHKNTEFLDLTQLVDPAEVLDVLSATM